MKWDVMGSGVGKLQDTHEVADISAGFLSLLRVGSRISSVGQVSFNLFCSLAFSSCPSPSSGRNSFFSVFVMSCVPHYCEA